MSKKAKKPEWEWHPHEFISEADLDDFNAKEREIWQKESEAREKMLYAFKRALRLIKMREMRKGKK